MKIPENHRKFLENARSILQADPRLLGVAIAGSHVTGEMDEWSDIDLVLVVKAGEHETMLRQRIDIAQKLGDLIAHFTGEHVGEPRLMICLYENPLLHVDLKFVTLDSFAKERVEDPIVLWECEGALSSAIKGHPSKYPADSPQWMEDRFWTWIHYMAVKLGRGELFEFHDGLAFLRAKVNAPLAKQIEGHRPNGVRRVETCIPLHADALRDSVPKSLSRADLTLALEVLIDHYRSLRDDPRCTPKIARNARAEAAAMKFLDDVKKRR